MKKISINDLPKIKNEAKVKFNQNRMMTKISNKKRNISRKTSKQNMYKEEDM